MLDNNIEKELETELENELKDLEQKRDENIRAAYRNIINADVHSYNNELEVILRHYGIKYTVKSPDLEGRLNEIKNNFNICWRRVELDSLWYKENMLPLLVKKGDGFKAVLPSSGGRCYCREGGRRVFVTDKNAAEFDNTAFCFYQGFREDSISRTSLIKYMLKCITLGQYISIVVSMVAVTVFSTVMPHARYYIFDRVIPQGTKEDILPIACLLFGIILISLVIYMFKGIIGANIPLCVNANLQGAVIARLLKLKMGFFSRQRSGSLSSAVTDISGLSALFSPDSIAAFMSFVLSVIYAVEIRIFAEDFMPFLYAAFFVVMLFMVLNGYLVKKHGAELSKKTDDMTGFVYEMFSGMENIKLNNGDATMLNRWSGFYSQSLEAQKKPLFVKYYTALYTLVMTAFLLFIFRVGINAEASAAEFIVFISLYGLFIGSVGGIGKVLDAASEFNSAYERLKDFFTAEVEDTENKRDMTDFEGNIEFSNVSFKYPSGSQPVLENISFSIKKGEKVGITGRSGCGKSTLLKLLLGFEQPQKGRIFIDNTDLNEVNLSSYRKNLGIVLQNSKLIPGDIFTNITFTTPYAGQEEAMEAAEAVGLKEDIEKMPMGLYTFVSDDNLTLSGGQKQRILIARAVMGRPSVLVLDEATNALDNVTQTAVTQYINSMDTTAVIVAHRLSTIKACDKIIVLEDGKISEQGSYEELIQKKGVFYDLVKNQIK